MLPLPSITRGGALQPLSQLRGWNALLGGSRAYFGTRKFPIEPHSKKKVAMRKERPHTKWVDHNAPAVTAKFMRFAERCAREYGVLEDLAKFDEAAAAFPKPTPLIVATLLERNNVIMRDVEDWEADFLEISFDRRQAEAKLYPQQLLDMFTAASTVLEKKDKPAGETKDRKPGGEGDAQPEVKKQRQGAEKALPLDAYYEKSAAGDGRTESQSGIVAAPRVSSADKIGDRRSLDRAYTQRLLLVVRRADDGSWFVPAGPRLDGEPMMQAAERVLRQTFGNDPTLDVWYPGSAPCGHLLRVYTPQQQAETGCYGAKVFFYRAEIISGRFKLPRPEDLKDPRNIAMTPFPYNDFYWLTRDETEGYFERQLYKYMHQIIGAGAGEEKARKDAWLERIAAKGLTISQATGRRAYRVNKNRLASVRLPLVVTRDQVAISAEKHSEEKARLLGQELDDYHKRRRAQKVISKQLSLELSTPAAAELAKRAQAAKLAAKIAHEVNSTVGSDATAVSQ